MRAVFGCACDRCAPTEKPIRRIVNKPGCNLFIAANDAVYDVVAVVSPLKPLTLCSDRNRRPSAVSACTHSSTSSANMALVCERMCVCGLYPPTHGKSFHFVRLQSNEQTHNSRLAHTNNTHTHTQIRRGFGLHLWQSSDTQPSLPHPRQSDAWR